MIKAELDLGKFSPEKVWSVANGGIKLVDLTTDMLADFETYKTQAETLYGTADDPYRSGSGSGRTIIYGFRLTDVDPASWLPQWVDPNGGRATAPAKSGPSEETLLDRMQSLLSVKDERGPAQSQWSRRVLEDWLAMRLAAPTVDDAPQPASAASLQAATRAYDRTASSDTA